MSQNQQQKLGTWDAVKAEAEALGTNSREPVSPSPKVDRYGWTLVDKPGALRMVDKAMVRVDHAYQRSAKEGKVLGIAAAFSWVAFGVVILSQRPDGSLWIIDGQHRILAANRRSEVSEVPAIIFEVSGKLEEATGFLKSNTVRKPLTAVDKFRAKVLTNDKLALEVNLLIQRAGLNVSDASGPLNVGCVASIEGALARSPVSFRRVWPVIVTLCKGSSMPKIAVDALSYIEHRSAAGMTLSDKRWSARLIDIGLARVVQAAKREAGLYGYGGTAVWAAGVLKELNKGIRTAHFRVVE